MKSLPSVLMTLAGIAVVTGCSSPSVGPPAREPAWKDTGTPSLAMEPATRYYVGEKAIVWDDHSKKHAATS